MVSLGAISKDKGQYGVGLSSRDWSEEAPRYIRITDIDNTGQLNSSRVAPAGEIADWKKALLKPGDLLFARSGATVGKTYLHSAVNDPAVYAGYLIRFQVDTQRALPEYVFRYTQGADYRAWVADNQRAVAQPNINAQQYAELKIPLPPLSDQRRIAAILAHADMLRAKRREALGQLEELTQAIFLDMFGDPVHNDRLWTPATVADLVAGFNSGRNLVGNDGSDGTLRVLKVSAVTSLTYRENESKPLPSGYLPPSDHMVLPGDLLFSRANTSELVGATAFVYATDGRTALPDKLWRFCWHSDRQVAPRYVEKLFQQPAFRRKISERATGSSGSMKNISRGKVLSIPVGIPPAAMQFEFQQRLEQIHAVEITHRNALAKLDDLFSSLQSRAFRGDL